MGKQDVKFTPVDEFNKFINNFKKKNGSQWKKPSTYGNIIVTMDMQKMEFDVVGL